MSSAKRIYPPKSRNQGSKMRGHQLQNDLLALRERFPYVPLMIMAHDLGFTETNLIYGLDAARRRRANLSGRDPRRLGGRHVKIYFPADSIVEVAELAQRFSCSYGRLIRLAWRLAREAVRGEQPRAWAPK